jgi:outer membrane protein assembly factor BamA
MMKHELARAARALAYVAILLVCATEGSAATKSPVYTLQGYNLHGIRGFDQDALAAKLKHKPGDRITREDIKADAAIIEKALQAQHAQGHLFTTLAEKIGRVWIIFDLLNNPGEVLAQPHKLEAQHFDGAKRVSADTLSKASGLKPGDTLSRDTLNAARRGIVEAYAKVAPGKSVGITGRLQAKPDGTAILTWIIQEPQ